MMIPAAEYFIPSPLQFKLMRLRVPTQETGFKFPNPPFPRFFRGKRGISFVRFPIPDSKAGNRDRARFGRERESGSRPGPGGGGPGTRISSGWSEIPIMT